MLPMSGSTQAPRAKRRRLNFACNYCRSRKTRCDEQQPSCQACTLAGVECVTVNLRRPDAAQVERREAGETRATADEPQAARQAFTFAASTTQPARPVLVPAPIIASRQDSPSPEQDESPRFTGPLPILRQHHARSTVENLAAWLDLAMYRLGRPRVSFSSLIYHLETPEVFSIRLSGPPRLPHHVLCNTLFQQYFDTVNMVFPFLEVERSKDILSFAHSHGPEKVCERYGLAVLMQLYLVIVLGAFSGKEVVPAGHLAKLRDYCKTLYGHILGRSDLETVQATALASVCFKFEGNDMAAWAALTQSSSLADSVCMSSASTLDDSIPQIERLSTTRKVWWSLYCFEKLFALELGKSSNLETGRKTQQEVTSAISQAVSEASRMFVVMVSLAMTLSEIRTRCVQASIHEATSQDPENDPGRIFLKVQTTGECCLLIFKWAEDLPPQYSPSSDLPFDKETTSFRNFVYTQYNNVLLMLTRNSLLISEEAIWRSTEVMAKGQPWEHTIRNGQSITAKAARKILMLACDLADSQSKPFMPMLSMTLHASFVLFVRTIRRPQALMKTTDRTLIQNAISQVMGSEIVSTSRSEYLRAVIHKFLSMLDQPMTDVPNSRRPSNIRPQIQPLASRPGDTSTISNNAMIMAASPQPRQDDVPTEMLPDTIIGCTDELPLDDSPFFADLADQLGWDWANFSQLFPTSLE